MSRHTENKNNQPDTDGAQKHLGADTRTQLEAAEKHLRAHDSVMSKLIDHFGPCEIFKEQHSGFHTLVRTIVCQQVQKKSERTYLGRLENLVGSEEFKSEDFVKITPEQLKSIGLNGRKASAILELSNQVNSGKINFDQMDGESDEDIRTKLCSIKGLGPWTANIFLVFYMHRLDVPLLNDQALKLAAGDLYPGQAFDTIVERWRPYRTVASWYLWQHRDERTGVRPRLAGDNAGTAVQKPALQSAEAHDVEAPAAPLLEDCSNKPADAAIPDKTSEVETYAKGFSPWMIADLKKSGICPVVGYALGMRAVAGPSYSKILGFEVAGQPDGMLIPFHDPETGKTMTTPDGKNYNRIKLEHPVKVGDSTAKYLSPKDGGQHAYILRETSEAINNGAEVVLTEGEKKAIAVTFTGLPTIGLTGNWGWCGENKQLLPELQQYAKQGSTWLVIWDSDAADNQNFTGATEALAGALADYQCRLKVCILPNLASASGQPGKTGVDDFLVHAEGGMQKLKECLARSRVVFHEKYPPTEDELFAAITALGKFHKLDDLEALLRFCQKLNAQKDGLAQTTFRQKLKQTLQNLEVKNVPNWVDAAFRQEKTDASLGGRAVQMVEPEPWLDPVDGQALANEIKTILGKYLVLPAYADCTTVLWAMHAHAHSAFEISPILALISAVKRCGKSTTLAVLEALLPRPLMTANQSSASLFRLVESKYPTLLIDEADTFMDNDELAGMINAGHRKQGAFVHRVEGDNFDVRQYSVWSPKVIARIGELSGTNQDRSIVINLKRKEPHEQVERWRCKYLEEYKSVKQKLIRWAADHKDELGKAEPSVPVELDDRAADNWRPLLAIADKIGGDWPEVARRAAVAISAGRQEQDHNYGLQLLNDIADIFDTLPEDRVQTQFLIEKLHGLEERPWSDYRNGKSITARQMANLLRPFGIGSRDIRFVDGTKKGYAKADFNDTFRRYIPSHAATGATMLNNNDLQQDVSATKSASREVSATTLGVDNHTVTYAVADVADKNTPLTENVLVGTGLPPESGNSLTWGAR